MDTIICARINHLPKQFTMRTFLFALGFILFSAYLFGQNDTLGLSELNQDRLLATRIHAYVLGGWALINITVSGYLTWKLYDGEPESFHHMNAAFNLVNLGIAWAMLHQVNQADINTYDLTTTIIKHYNAQKWLMLNIGLDVSYALTGLLLYEHSKNVQKFDFMWSGFGKSLILQGAFLLVLDTTFSFIHAANNSALLKAVF